MEKKKSKGDKKLDKVMKEWKLKSSSGSKVTSQKQAVAIALSEKERASRKKRS
jgi:hypothetical protein